MIDEPQAEAPAASPVPADRVELDAFSGPLDLLLHLNDSSEVDIYDIPIAEILAQYLEHLKRMARIDVNQAGEFLVMASRLMEVKSRLLLPPAERALEEDEEDPRLDLVKQLLEYKRYKEFALDLGDREASRRRRFGRSPHLVHRMIKSWGRLDAAAPGPDESLRDFELYDLMAAFDAQMRAVLASAPRTIELDEVSLEERVEQLMTALREMERIRLSEVFKAMPNRGEAAGVFVAVLDLVRRKLATVQQAEDFSEIYVSARADAPDEAFAPSEAEQLAEPAAMKADEVRIGPDGLPHVVPAYKVKRGAFHGFKRRDEEALTVEMTESDLDDVPEEMKKPLARLDRAIHAAEEAVARFSPPKPAAPPPVDGSQGGAASAGGAEGETPPEAGGTPAGSQEDASTDAPTTAPTAVPPEAAPEPPAAESPQ